MAGTWDDASSVWDSTTVAWDDASTISLTSAVDSTLGSLITLTSRDTHSSSVSSVLGTLLTLGNLGQHKQPAALVPGTLLTLTSRDTHQDVFPSIPSVLVSLTSQDTHKPSVSTGLGSLVSPTNLGQHKQGASTLTGTLVTLTSLDRHQAVGPSVSGSVLSLTSQDIHRDIAGVVSGSLLTLTNKGVHPALVSVVSGALLTLSNLGTKRQSIGIASGSVLPTFIVDTHQSVSEVSLGSLLSLSNLGQHPQAYLVGLNALVSVVPGLYQNLGAGVISGSVCVGVSLDLHRGSTSVLSGTTLSGVPSLGLSGIVSSVSGSILSPNSRNTHNAIESVLLGSILSPGIRDIHGAVGPISAGAVVEISESLSVGGFTALHDMWSGSLGTLLEGNSSVKHAGSAAGVAGAVVSGLSVIFLKPSVLAVLGRSLSIVGRDTHRAISPILSGSVMVVGAEIGLNAVAGVIPGHVVSTGSRALRFSAASAVCGVGVSAIPKKTTRNGVAIGSGCIVSLGLRWVHGAQASVARGSETDVIATAEHDCVTNVSIASETDVLPQISINVSWSSEIEADFVLGLINPSTCLVNIGMEVDTNWLVSRMAGAVVYVFSQMDFESGSGRATDPKVNFQVDAFMIPGPLYSGLGGIFINQVGMVNGPPTILTPNRRIY